MHFDLHKTGGRAVKNPKAFALLRIQEGGCNDTL
jgi:hypothetical protein